MLHWSQDASTGWTRNSWFGSRAKESCLSGASVLGGIEGSAWRRAQSTIASEAAPKGDGAVVAGAPGPTGFRIALLDLTSPPARSYAARAGGRTRSGGAARWRRDRAG